jgi:transcriptional regulator with XRE-family HTH domain
MDVRKLVAWNLRRARVLRDLSQEKLAVDAGVDRTYVGRLERALENPTVVVLDRLAKALAIPIASFFATPKPGEHPPRPLQGGRRKQSLRRAGSKSRRTP